MAQLAKAANQDLPVIQLWDYVNNQFVNNSRFTGWPHDDEILRSGAKVLLSGVWIQSGMIKAKK